MDAQDSIAKGRAARAKAPRSEHAEWNPAPGRLDPVDILDAQDEARLPELVPLRHKRMLESPFAFYRGGAAIMAADLDGTPTSGIQVQCCGDAHLANFGGFEAPDRTMVFDINDFDETQPGPWEWDRQAARGEPRRGGAATEVSTTRSRADQSQRRPVAIAPRCVTSPRMRNLDVWYARLDLEGIIGRWGAEGLEG